MRWDPLAPHETRLRTRSREYRATGVEGNTPMLDGLGDRRAREREWEEWERRFNDATAVGRVQSLSLTNIEYWSIILLLVV